MLPSWRSSTAVLESEHQIPTKARSNCFIVVSAARLVQTKSVKMFNTNPFHHLPSASFCPARALRHLSLFFLNSGRVQLSGWVGYHRGSHHHWLLFFLKKHLWHLSYLCLLSIFSLSSLQKSFFFFKQRLHGSGEEDRAGLLLAASSI